MIDWRQQWIRHDFDEEKEVQTDLICSQNNKSLDQKNTGLKMGCKTTRIITTTY